MSRRNIYLLSAGANPHGKPSALWSLVNGQSILDWQESCIDQAFSNPNLNVVVGFDFDKVVRSKPNTNFVFIENWEKSSPLYSFLTALKDFSTTSFVTYGDTIFRPETFSETEKSPGDLVVVVDSRWRNRFPGRTYGDQLSAEIITMPSGERVEYTGLIKFSKSVLSWLENKVDKYGNQSTFLDLIDDLQQEGFNVAFLDLDGDWAELNEPNDLAQFILGSKAETLSRLAPVVKNSKICAIFVITWEMWQSSRQQCITEIQKKFVLGKLIARSSSTEEDGWTTANAGKFESVLNIDLNDKQKIYESIDHVFNSYTKLSPQSQVLIQPMLSDVNMSGVIMTSDLVTGAPYYVINYDDHTGLTDTITSGVGENSKTAVFYKGREIHDYVTTPMLSQVISAAKEVEQILGFDKVDIEFAVDNLNQVFLFQVRPISVELNSNSVNASEIEAVIAHAFEQYEKCQNKGLNLFGDYSVYSSMTDWNPAEIIGMRPAPMAASLYNHLITENIWAKQRAEYGYKDVRPNTLLKFFCGKPYVDCRASINSFIPERLPADTTNRLVHFYIEYLKKKPWLHDKLESDVVFTVYDPSFQSEARVRFRESGVTKNDINLLEKELKHITQYALVRLEDDIASIDKLELRRKSILKSQIDNIDKFYCLIEDCKAYGTLAFAHAARAGFVSITILKGFIKQGLLRKERVLEFQESLSTVLSQYQNEVQQENAIVSELIQTYGHLRPGTYDLTQLAYWEDPEFYLTHKKIDNSEISNNKPLFVFTQAERETFQLFLTDLGSEISVDEFIVFLGKGIIERENIKFEFTKNLSMALDCLVDYGVNEWSLPRDDLAFLNFHDLVLLRSGQIDTPKILDAIEGRKHAHKVNSLVKLPNVITDKQHFYNFHQTAVQINFITTKRVIAELKLIHSLEISDFTGKIVAIPSADPGYDWIFSHGIAGLVTKYGGANSHMAIRCAEFNLPAAIGVGDSIFDDLFEDLIMLDCEQEVLKYV